MTLIFFYHKLFTTPFCFFLLILVPSYPQAHVHCCLKTGTEQALYLLLQKSQLLYLKRLEQPYTTKQQPYSSAGPGAGSIVPKKKKRVKHYFFLGEKTAKKYP